MSPPASPPTLASRSELSPLARQLTSRIMRLVLNPRRRRLAHGAREFARRASGRPHRIAYFHQVDDPYGHLALQAIADLSRRQGVEIAVHLAAPAQGPNTPEPGLLRDLAQRDARLVAPYYGLTYPEARLSPTPTEVELGAGILVGARSLALDDFVALALCVGEAVLCSDHAALEAIGKAHPPADPEAARACLAEGTRLRERLGHYSGATFYYAGEWFWGVDRLCHLERRLEALGASRPEGGMRFPRPRADHAPVPRGQELTLEVFPSLRSPYTAIAFEPTLALARETGVELITRPVLPMVMRGVPATFRKGLYISSDTLREARLQGMPFGRMIDPIGEPVRQAYSLWPWARSQGRGDAFLAAFLRAAWSEGIDTSRERGLARVVEAAGLSWSEARAHVGDPRWEEELEINRLAMLGEMGQWGVPSYRLRGPRGQTDLCVWGQDRLFVIAAEIQRRGRLTPPSPPAGPEVDDGA